MFVTETNHKRKILRQLREAVGPREIHVLDIQDEYRFMEPELVELLSGNVQGVLDRLSASVRGDA